MPFVEYPTSPTFSGSGNERSAVRTGEILTSEIESLYETLFPDPEVGWPALPATYPGIDYLYADSLSTEALFDEQATSLLSKVSITYKSIPYQILNNSLITWKIGGGGQFMTIPNVGLEWDDTGDAVSNNEVQAAKLVSINDFTVTLHSCMTPPWFHFNLAKGCINDVLFFNDLFFSKTLLFLGHELTPRVRPSGLVVFDIDLKFQERIIDGDPDLKWDHVYDAETGAFRKVVRANGSPLYSTYQFDLLIP